MIRCKVFSGQVQTEVETKINDFFQTNPNLKLLQFQQTETVIKPAGQTVSFYLFTITVMYQ